MTELTIKDLAAVVYSSGKVFDGLATGRLDTENFLANGSLEGVASRADLALLQDLRDAAQFIIDHRGATVDAEFVKAVNATITRSGALHPGRLRTREQRIGVATVHGRHEPDALSDADLQALVDRVTGSSDVRNQAVNLFVHLAKAQPFEDGNKRTAVFAANALLLGTEAGDLLTIPVDENDPSVAAEFNDALARAYVFGEHDRVLALLEQKGFVQLK
ncbi:Fic family protein [Gordonia malaquae]|uniref:Fic family protein n=1 Tax=Gordonia malaquae TaxID=410332 RepID=UPI0030179FD9